MKSIQSVVSEDDKKRPIEINILQDIFLHKISVHKSIFNFIEYIQKKKKKKKKNKHQHQNNL